MSHTTDVVIASAVRTPIGSFQGALASLGAPELGAIAIREAVRRAGAKSEQIERVIMGCVLSAGVGQAPARQATIKASASAVFDHRLTQPELDSWGAGPRVDADGQPVNVDATTKRRSGGSVSRRPRI